MSELSYPVEIVTQATVTSTIENIPPRKTVVYRTLIDSAAVSSLFRSKSIMNLT